MFFFLVHLCRLSRCQGYESLEPEGTSGCSAAWCTPYAGYISHTSGRREKTQRAEFVQQIRYGLNSVKYYLEISTLLKNDFMTSNRFQIWRKVIKKNLEGALIQSQ